MKRQRCPPPRLSWPAPIPLTLSNDESYEQKNPAYNNSSNKEARRKRHSNHSSVSNYARKNRQKKSTYKETKSKDNDNSSQMWTEKYSNVEQIKDLCIQPRKIKEVQTWIHEAITRKHPTASRMLLLTGNPGIGKSTMCHALAKELDLTMLEWNSAHMSAASSSSSANYHIDNSLLSFRYQSQLNSFQEFLQSAGNGCDSLNFVSSRTDEPDTIHFDKKRGGYLILIDEIPNLRDANAEENFRCIIEHHIQLSYHPTILIFSNVSEGKANPADLEKLIPTTTLYDPNKVKIMQCNPVTQTKMKKCLESIARKEHLSIPAGLLDQLYSNSGGDLRNAIMALQFQLVGNQKYQYRSGNEKGTGIQKTGKKQFERDKKLSAFHALGKLLYAKRLNHNLPTAQNHVSSIFPEMSSMSSNLERPPLQFVPEDVVNGSEMGLSGILSFLSYHSPNFFTDMEELSNGFDLFSDASMLLDKEYSAQRDQSDKIFPFEYVSSIAGRSVAETNKHPTPSKFRALEAPKVFDVLRKKNWNGIKIDRLRLRLSSDKYNYQDRDVENNSLLPCNSPLGPSKNFVTNDLHYMRIIYPMEIDSTLKNLYSISGEVSKKEHDAKQTDLVEEAKMPMGGLLEDDLVDDDIDSISNYSMKRKVDSITSSSLTSENLNHTAKRSKHYSEQNTIIIID